MSTDSYPFLENIPPQPLIHPEIIGGQNQFTNVLLIDSETQNYQTFVDSVNSSTFPILYSTMSSKTELLSLLQANFTNISRIGIVFTSSLENPQTFLDCKPLFINSETEPYSENVQFIINIITEFSVKNIDFLACNTLNYTNWVSFYELLTQNTGIIVGASNDTTGNIKYGGDWNMESTTEDIEFIYFTQSIEYYTYLLDGPIISGLVNPSGLAFDSAGNLYVSNSGSGKIGKYNADGTADNISFITGLTTPVGIAFDSAGKLYVSNFNSGKVGKYKSDGTPLKSLISGLVNPSGLAFDSAGKLYVSNSGSGKIGKYNADGTADNISFITGLSNPFDIAFDSSGNLYVANSASNKIGKYNADGTADNISFISGLSNPHGIAFDRAGKLYVANFSNGRIGKYNADGTALNTSLISGLVNPFGIAFDSAGNLYVANYGNNTIVKYNSVGPPSHTVSSISPSTGPVGTTVTITGTNFVSGSSVKFGSILATNINVAEGSSSITCVVPSGYIVGSLVDVFVEYFGVTKTSPNKFTYTIPPHTISSISPSTGPVGTTVTITGTNFVSGSSVKFGNMLATNINVAEGSSSITCDAPSGNIVGDPVNVSVEYLGVVQTSLTQFTYTIPISNICFPSGTPITCNQGIIPIECLNPDIHTIRNKKITGITQTITQDKYLVCFEKDALGKNIPSKKTIISRNHCIFYRGKMIQAKYFIGEFENVKKIKYTGEVLYNVLMEEHNKMMVNNLICETLDPKNSIAKLYSHLQNLNSKERGDYIKKYNEYVIKNKIFK
jgi:sugar lactone lactonase YvrE